jgi:hypothetical protein
MFGEKVLHWAKHLFGVEPSSPKDEAAREACAAKSVGAAVGDALVAFGALTRSIRAAREKRDMKDARSGRRSGGRSHSRSTRSPRRARSSRAHSRVRPRAAVPPPPAVCDVAIVDVRGVPAPLVRRVPPAASA